MALTERTVRDAKPTDKTRFIWCSTVKGFALRITASGALAYILNYRVDGRERRVTIGRPAEMSLKDARLFASETLTQIRQNGTDPLTERQARREAPTVAEGVARFFDEFAPRRMVDGRLAERTVRDYRKQCKQTVLPALGNMKIAAVKRADIERAIAPRAPVQRNRSLAFLSRLFNLLEEWEWREAYSNPCRRIEKAREEPRDRTLAPGELAALAAALEHYSTKHPASVAAIRLAALTGLRIGEILAMEWIHVDFETGRLDMLRTKTGRRSHDLPAPALELLASLPRVNGCPYVFTGKGLVPTAYHTVRMTFRAVCDKAGLSDVRIHDLRRTVMTNAAAAGVGTHVLRDLLGHKTTAMADRYIRNIGDPVREAREQIGAAMAAAMAGTPGRVVELRRKG